MNYIYIFLKFKTRVHCGPQISGSLACEINNLNKSCRYHLMRYVVLNCISKQQKYIWYLSVLFCNSMYISLLYDTCRNVFPTLGKHDGKIEEFVLLQKKAVRIIDNLGYVQHYHLINTKHHPLSMFTYLNYLFYSNKVCRITS